MRPQSDREKEKGRMEKGTELKTGGWRKGKRERVERQQKRGFLLSLILPEHFRFVLKIRQKGGRVGRGGGRGGEKRGTENFRNKCQKMRRGGERCEILVLSVRDDKK